VIVGEAANGEDACLEIAAVQPDAVLMDWRLPGMDGIETTRVLRRVVPDVPVIAFASSKEDPIRDGFLEAGAQAFVHKEDIHGLLEALASRDGHH
jgi:DNA-binding NarL/FixJ family response regulator